MYILNERKGKNNREKQKKKKDGRKNERNVVRDDSSAKNRFNKKMNEYGRTNI